TFAVIPAHLTIAPTSQDFSSVTIGGMSSVVDFTLTNDGGAASGTISASVNDTSSYTVTGGTCPGTSVPAGQSCTVKVRFNPIAPAGAKPATLTVSASPGGSPTSSLSGTALTAGQLSVMAGSKDYGSLAVGTTSSETVFMVMNTGQSSAGTSTALMASLTDTANFSISSNTCGTTLAAGASCSVGVVFTPATVGAKSASLTVSASPGGSPSASLTGTGTALLTVTPAGTGTGTVSSTPAGISCGATCAATFSSSPVTLTATSDASSNFTGWSGGGCSGTG